MHKCTMLLHKKSILRDAIEYAPIAKGLSTLDSETEVKVKRKFKIAYRFIRLCHTYLINNYLSCIS